MKPMVGQLFIMLLFSGSQIWFFCYSKWIMKFMLINSDGYIWFLTGCDTTYKRTANSSNSNAVVTPANVTSLDECKNWCSENSLCKVVYYSDHHQKCLWHTEIDDNVADAENNTEQFDEYVKETCAEKESTPGEVPEGKEI